MYTCHTEPTTRSLLQSACLKRDLARQDIVTNMQEHAFQMPVVVPDNKVCKRRDQRELVATADGRQLQGAKTHKGR